MNEWTVLFISEVAALEAEEHRLDNLIKGCTQQLKLLTDDEENNKLAYVTYHDIRKIPSFTGDTVIAMKAPAETRLEVPDPQEVCIQQLPTGYYTKLLLLKAAFIVHVDLVS